MLLLGACFLVIGMFVGRPYCRYLCPYSILLGWMSRASKWHVTITPDECIQCRLCEDACPFGSIQKPTQEGTRSNRYGGKKRLAVLLILLPIFIASGILMGVRVSPGLSRLDSTVRLAQRVFLGGLRADSFPLDRDDHDITRPADRQHRCYHAQPHDPKCLHSDHEFTPYAPL